MAFAERGREGGGQEEKDRQKGGGSGARRGGLTWIDVFDVGLPSLSLQLLPSDGVILFHLELHLSGERGWVGGEITVFSQNDCLCYAGQK